MTIPLGSKAKDIVTGAEGIVTCRCEFLNGCVRYIIQQAGIDKEGKPFSELWIDEGQLKITGKGVSKDITPKATGGPTSYTVKR